MSTSRSSRPRRHAVRAARSLACLGVAGAAAIGGASYIVAAGGASPASPSSFVEVEPDEGGDGMGAETVDLASSGLGLDWEDDWFAD
jgi:hypothetical protein